MCFKNFNFSYLKTKFGIGPDGMHYILFAVTIIWGIIKTIIIQNVKSNENTSPVVWIFLIFGILFLVFYIFIFIRLFNAKRYLKKRFGNIKIMKTWGNIFFEEIVTSNDKILLRNVLNYGLNLNKKNDNTGMTILMIAAAYGDSEIVRIFLSYGAKINLKDIKGNTALSYAIEKNHTEVIKMLKEKGAK